MASAIFNKQNYKNYYTSSWYSSTNNFGDKYEQIATLEDEVHNAYKNEIPLHLDIENIQSPDGLITKTSLFGKSNHHSHLVTVLD